MIRAAGHGLASILAPLALLALAACVPGPHGPAGDNASAIAVSIQTQWAVPPRLVEFPEFVYFVRVEEGRPLGRQKRILRSNFRRGEQVYLLNAPPGRYIAVACTQVTLNRIIPRRLGFLEGLDEYLLDTTYFPADMIAKTEIVVGAGEFVAMGRFDVERDVGLDETDDAAQQHYYLYIDANIEDPHGNPIIDPDNSLAATGKLMGQQRGKEDRKALLNQALEDLRGTGWVPALERRLKAVSGE